MTERIYIVPNVETGREEEMVIRTKTDTMHKVMESYIVNHLGGRPKDKRDK